MPKDYKINDGENIFDLALATYGNLELTLKLIQENAIENIDFDFTENPGLKVSFDESLQLASEDRIGIISLSPVKKEFTIHEGQSIFDLSLMLYGNIENVYQLVKDNRINIPNIDKNILAGANVSFDSDLIDNKVFTDYLFKNGIIINTSSLKVNAGSGFSGGFQFISFY